MDAACLGQVVRLPEEGRGVDRRAAPEVRRAHELMPEDLTDQWEADAEKLREYGQESAAKVAELHAYQLREALRAAGDESLTLAEAAAESGYSKRRLRELVSKGSVPNAGRKGAPRIRRGDLPRKAKAWSSGFDAGVEARAIMGAGR